MRIVAVFGRAAVGRLVDEIVVRPELDTDGNGANAAHHTEPPPNVPSIGSARRAGEVKSSG